MKKHHTIGQEEIAALEILRSTGVDVLEAALVAKEALRAGRGRVRRARAGAKGAGLCGSGGGGAAAAGKNRHI